MELIDKAWLQAEISRHLEIMVRGDDIDDVVCAIRGFDLKAIIDKAPAFKNLEVVVRCKNCTYWDNKFQKRLKDGSIEKKYCTATERMTAPDFFCAYGENERGHNIDTET